VFVIAQGPDGRARAHVQQVESGAMFGDEVVIHAGLIAGEQVAASGSFKLRESGLVAIAGAQTPQSEQRQTVSQQRL
jgi:membrane fusion protein (multidrug efflux system)